MGLLGRRREKSRHKAQDAIQAASLPESPEAALTRLQLEQIKEEQEWNQLLRPQMLRSLGLVEELDATTGKKSLRAMTEDEKIAGMTAEEKSAYETEQLLADRSAKAARGELETPSYITDELSRQRNIQGNVLSQRLGAKGANLSTGGINTKVNQLGNEASVKSAYSYGDEATGMGLLSGYNQYLGNQSGRNLNVYGGFTNAGMGIIPMAQTAAQPYAFGRQLQTEQGLMEQQRKNALAGGLMSGVGTVASMYLTKGMGGAK